ncbi:MAG: nickel pincer cofactor biosynthesis protein LarC [Candidatus Brocadiaceae bacterium]|nr:nickel pincer cofactor biosynthesis protein LarC [Candidatus Brocadiaceae bacterium]
MKIGYLDCFSGISGDMCLGALVDAGVPLEAIAEALGTLHLHGYSLEAHTVHRAGMRATKVDVVLEHDHHGDHGHHHHHPHRGLSDVLAIIEGGALPDRVVADSSAVFRALAEAEAFVHGSDPEQVHFHEVGAVDAICDIVGTAVGLHVLGLEAIRFSTVSLGGGTVRAAHGVLPVPAPATAELLRGLPTAGGPVDFELATPTGAAILKALGEPSPRWPAMTVERIGCGAGGRDLQELPNVLRLAVGTAAEGGGFAADIVWVLEANLDNMTGEEVGYCTERLLAAGALDVFTVPVQMKKNRPGVVLTVLCAPEKLQEMQALVLRHSATLGVRCALHHRAKLRRQVRSVTTPWGEVRVKEGYVDGRRVHCEPEYEDCRRIADERDLPLRQVRRAALQAADA